MSSNVTRLNEAVTGAGVSNFTMESPSQEEIIRLFKEALFKITTRPDDRVINELAENFAKDPETLKTLQSAGVFDFSGDVVQFFAQAFLRLGDFKTADLLSSAALEHYQKGQEVISLIKSTSALKARAFADVYRHAAKIPLNSRLAMQVGPILSEAVRLQNEEERLWQIKDLAKRFENDEARFYVLGLKPIGHDAHVTMVDRDGRVVFDAEEERYVRVKHTGNQPLNSLHSAMVRNRIHPEQVRMIAFSFSAPEYDLAARQWRQYYNANGFSLDKLQMVAGSLGYAEQLRRQEIFFKSIFTKADVVHVNHHMAHSAGAFYTSPFHRAAILSIDGRGEFETIKLSRGSGSKVEMLEALHCPHSLGTLYQVFTYWMGLGARNEGKTMGLSSYGDPNVFYQTFRNHIVDYDDDTGRFEINRAIINPDGLFLYNHNLFNEIFGITETMDTKNPQPVFANVAATLQIITEEIILALAGHLRRISGEDHLCMTGGVALNSVANGRLLKTGMYKDISMHPAAHDGGTGLGAALYTYYNHIEDHRPREKDWWIMDHPYLGDDFSDDDITEAIAGSGFPVRKLEDSARFAAERLAEGKIVGWYQGRMEVGPRALGNRSILGDPRGRETRDEINRRVKFREHWRPFAPSVLKEDCGVYFDCGHESPYMLFVYNTRPEILDKIPAISHVDGTARVQTVDKKANPKYHHLISLFKELTGIGLVLNTSLNVKGEPIVCTPKEAVDCFLKGGMDCMILGDYLLDKNNLPGTKLLEQYPKEATLVNVPTYSGRLNGFINIGPVASKELDDYRCDLEKMEPIDDSSVDMLHSHDYLHTLDRDRVRRVLAVWKRVLRDGGRLIVEVPDLDYEYSKAGEVEDETRRKLMNPAVVRHEQVTRTPFTWNVLRKTLLEAGFTQIERMKETMFHPEKKGSLCVSVVKPGIPVKRSGITEER